MSYIHEQVQYKQPRTRIQVQVYTRTQRVLYTLILQKINLKTRILGGKKRPRGEIYTKQVLQKVFRPGADRP